MELSSKGQVLRSYAIALGANPVGHKQQQGDERTPEGRYVLDWRNSEQLLHALDPHLLSRTRPTRRRPSSWASIPAA